MPIVAPLHTYVRNAIKALGITAPNLHIMPTQSYLSFGYLMNQAKAIVTDSGNVAEEATFLGIPCITLNTFAEHPETWRTGTNELVGEEPGRIGSLYGQTDERRVETRNFTRTLGRTNRRANCTNIIGGIIPYYPLLTGVKRYTKKVI